MSAAREALSDSAYEAQSALSTIKSFAYGGVATEHEARASIAQLRAQAEAMERVLTEGEQCPTR
jgi:hypothetical protein